MTARRFFHRVRDDTRPARHSRAGVSLVEIMVAMVVLGIVIAMAGRLTFALTQYGRNNDLKTKREFAMQQQANFVGALPYASINTTILPATKDFTTGDFSYRRRVAITGGTNTKSVTITIVPNTGVARDSLQKETMTIMRAMPPCGTVLNVGGC